MTDGKVTARQVKPEDALEGCQRCMDAGFYERKCAYCNALLSTRHEHDHFPIARRHGGEAIVPACINCHDLKDRLDFDEWGNKETWDALGEAPPLARIFFAKVVGLIYDMDPDFVDNYAKRFRGDRA